jgi:acyl-CoA oxidase
VDDIVNITPKFVKMNIDPLATMDGSAFALIAIQYNLFVGTVAPFSLSRPELRPLIQQAMNFEVSFVSPFSIHNIN